MTLIGRWKKCDLPKLMRSRNESCKMRDFDFKSSHAQGSLAKQVFAKQNLVLALGGSLLAIFRIPYWQTPWYKGIRDTDDDRDDS